MWIRELRTFGNKRSCNSHTQSEGVGHNSESRQGVGHTSSSSHIFETNGSTDFGGPSSVGNPSVDAGTSGANNDKSVRGKTHLEAVWNAPLDAPKTEVHVNKYKQGFGKGSSKLASFIGTVAIKLGLLPLTYKSWRKVPREDKDRALVEIKQMYEFSHNGQKWARTQLGTKWKEYKHRLKKVHFDPTKSEIDLKRKIPEDLIDYEWHYLVDYWLTKESKRITSINKRNREKLTLPHTSGSKSFPTIRHEMTMKNGGVEPSRAAMFIKTHQRKDGTPINTEAGNLIDQLKEVENQLPKGSRSSPTRTNVLSQVLGEDSYGRVRTMGMGVTPSQLWPPEHALNERAENDQLRRRVIELEEQQQKVMTDQKEQQEMLNKLLGGLGVFFWK